MDVMSLPVLMALISSVFQLIANNKGVPDWLQTLITTVQSLMTSFQVTHGSIVNLSTSHINMTVKNDADVAAMLSDFPKDHVTPETVEKWGKALHDKTNKGKNIPGQRVAPGIPSTPGYPGAPGQPGGPGTPILPGTSVNPVAPETKKGGPVQEKPVPEQTHQEMQRSPGTAPQQTDNPRPADNNPKPPENPKQPAKPGDHAKP